MLPIQPMSPNMFKPFRFMDLPPELRLMVYEYVADDIHMKRHVLTRDEAGLPQQAWPSNLDSSPSSIELLRSALPMSMMRVCRQVHKEVNPIMAVKVAELKKTPLYFQVDYPALLGLTHRSGPLARNYRSHEHTLPWEATHALDVFALRCSRFINRKPEQARHDAHAPASVCITITQPRSAAPIASMDALLFVGVARRFSSNKFVCDVVFAQDIARPFIAHVLSLSSLRLKCLYTYAWNRHLQDLDDKRHEAKVFATRGKFVMPPCAPEKWVPAPYV
ncbi:hypothetical protein ACEQ8H_003020 [Pleosporales sp. CAS-2024a]